MAQYAYDYSYFNNTSVSPARTPERKPKQPERAPELKPLKKKQNQQELAKSELVGAKAVAKFFGCVAFCVVIFSLICSSFAAVKSAQYSKMKYESQKALQENSYLEKYAELNALVTPDEIAKVAVQKLGMVKVSDENKLYVDVNSKNEIIVSMDK